MRTKPLVLLVAATCVSLTGTRALDLKDIPPPTPPFVVPVPENADWIVTVQYPPEPPPPPDAPPHHDWRFVEVHSTKTGKIKRDLTLSREGIKSELWFMDSALLWTTPQGNVAVSTMAGAPAPDPEHINVNPSVPSGFPGVGWLRPEYYDKVVLFEKRPCYHYAKGDTEAWIDVETLFPMAYKNRNDLYKFKFNAPPTEPLTMPPAYQKVWDSYALRKGLRSSR